MKNLRWLIAVLLAAAVPTLLNAQATGTIQGTVREMGTDRALAGAQVFIPGTQIGTRTDEQGRFTLTAVPAGARSVRVELVAYTPADRIVNVVAGQTATLNIQLASQVFELGALIVTGTAGPTERAKVPFSVAQVTAADIPVPTVNAASALQGKVAGAQIVQGTGRPGAAPSVLLRGATSINAAGRDHEPLYIVDGVILSAGMVDIGALDIESIEVVKGAAGASLYGSRAGNGVIQITTRRGAGLIDDQVRYTLRSEYGRSELPQAPGALLAQHHMWSQNAQGLFITETGTACAWLDCIGRGNPALAGQRAAAGASATQWNSYAINEWPETYDQIRRFFRSGTFLQNYLGIEGRSGATNYHVSFANLVDQGVTPGTDGFNRNNFRVNLDQSVRDNFTVSASAFYARSTSDAPPDNRTNPFFNLTRTPAGVNLFACEDDRTQNCLNDPQNLLLQIDPTDQQMSNPIYEALMTEWDDDRGRFLGSANFRFSPTYWFDVDANASYDRLDFQRQYLWPKEYRTPDGSPAYEEGRMWRYSIRDEAFNGSLTGTFRFDLGPAVRNRTQVRYLYEQQDERWSQQTGHEFQVGGIHQWGNINPENLTSESERIPIRSDGYFLISNFDILDRYIIDALVRNDGSSLFGRDERRQWYYRGAAAWRMGLEPWFNVPAINELKFRYAYGTAGGRPRFEAQYETFSVVGGLIVPVTLGNRDLRPEFSREQEVGVDMGLLNNRFLVGLTYANTVTEDQILPVPLPAYTGYSHQWRNAGTLENNTWEASLEARILERGDFAWNGRFVYDRTRSTITELDAPPFVYGVGEDNTFRAGGSQGHHNIFLAREGERLGTFYGVRAGRNLSEVPAGQNPDHFAVDNNGFLVWTGGQPLTANAWGTSSDFTANGLPVMWGTPFAVECENPVTGELTYICPVGNTQPDYSVGVSSTVSWRGLSLYGLLNAVQGFNVYNQPLQWNTFRRLSGIMDQAHLPADQQKPVGYFETGLYHNLGGLQPNSAFVEDASFVKLREVSLRYQFGQDELAGIPGINRFSGIGVNLIGRNLHTWTNYRGYDPEVGFSAEEAGSAAIARTDGFQYPGFRTWTIGLELNF
jgi:TonB-linked SusC/RagA family outer membrane protein